MSKTKNAIELHIESYGRLSKIQMAETSLKNMKDHNNLMSGMGHPTSNEYFDQLESIQEIIDKETATYLTENAMLRSLIG